MFLLRRSADRGHLDHGWLDTYHTFSFARYSDPNWMGFGPLRVINEDRIQGKAGFEEHFHHDMEILTYVIAGALEHRDSLGHGSIIRPQQIQYMSAGTGILHSEFNPEVPPVHLLQIWIEPNVPHAYPRYEEKTLEQPKSGVLQLMASPDGKERSIAIRQNTRLYRGIFIAGEHVLHTEKATQRWIQLVSGELMVNQERLRAGDGCGVESEDLLTLTAQTDAHFLLFDFF